MRPVVSVLAVASVFGEAYRRPYPMGHVLFPVDPRQYQDVQHCENVDQNVKRFDIKRLTFGTLDYKTLTKNVNVFVNV